MRGYSIVLVISLIICNIACSGDDCSNEIIGFYDGAQCCNGELRNSQFSVISSPQSDSIIFSSLANPAMYAEGQLNLDCSIITVPSQILSSNFIAYHSVDGTLFINPTGVTGSLTYTSIDSIETVCTFELSRL